MDLDLRAVCDHAYIGETNKLYILGEFRYIWARDDFPIVHGRLSLALRIIGQKTEGPKHKLRILLVDEDGNKVLPKLESSIAFAPAGPAAVGRIQAQIVMELGGIKFPHQGDYRFDIFVDDHILGGVPLHVAKLDKPLALPGS